MFEYPSIASSLFRIWTADPLPEVVLLENASSSWRERLTVGCQLIGDLK
jgi:hypothetical protein